VSLLEEVKSLVQNSVQRDLNEFQQDIYKKLEDMSNKISDIAKLHQKNADRVIEPISAIEDLSLTLKNVDLDLQASKQQSDESEKRIVATMNSLVSRTEANLIDKIEQVQEMAMSPEKTFIWKVYNFSEMLTNAISGRIDSIYSDPFYSHDYGYKMRLCMYPYGHEDCEEPSMAIYFSIMRGEMDNVLKWPVEYTATISLLDQKEGIDHIVYSVRAHDSNLVNRQKPTTFENRGWGTPDMASMNTIVQSDVYLVDDTIFIKAVVQIHNL